MYLATDLDGTFLGGTEAERHDLYSWLRQYNQTVIFVTGRGVESILSLLSDPFIAQPKYIIADVGATVVQVANGELSPMTSLQQEILHSWPGEEAILHELKDFPQLERQTVPQQNRCSFVLKDSSLLSEIRTKMRAIGCDVIYSLNHYLDVMPRNVSKGSTLTLLTEQLGIPADEVIVAGDTLNDLSLFLTKFRGVVVGGSEAALVAATRDNKSVYQAKAEGAGGISECLIFHGYKERSLPSKNINAPVGTSDLIVGYHRPPFAEQLSGPGTIELSQHRSPNGIIPTLLGLFKDGTRGSWVAWSEAAYKADLLKEDLRVRFDPANYPNLALSRIPMSHEDVKLFYHVFSKEAFWPVIFSFVEKPTFNHDHWKHFCEINRRFAEKIAEEAALNAKVWLHDYNLWMVPGVLRQIRPDLNIAFFHHTSFPSPDIFAILPWSSEILTSLMHCNYIGFHIPLYASHFAMAVQAMKYSEVVSWKSCAPQFRSFGCAVGIAQMPTAIRAGDQLVRLGAHPVGIDLGRIRVIVSSEGFQKKCTEFKELTGDCQCILSVERLDYVKGPIEKLLAYEHFLENHPEFLGKVILVNVLTPPQDGIEIYEDVRSKVDEITGRINGRFSNVSWAPIRYFYRSLPFEEVVALYAVSSVAWITPLRDGLNLVAKEFVATHGINNTLGKLVLSQFAGAAAELFGAVLANPYDLKSMTETLRFALEMDDQDAELRQSQLFDKVAASDIFAWGDHFLKAAFSEES